MYLAQGPQRSDAGEARTRGPSATSQALYHWATALHSVNIILHVKAVNDIYLLKVQPDKLKALKRYCIYFFCFCCFTSQVNSYGHGGTVS